MHFSNFHLQTIHYIPVKSEHKTEPETHRENFPFKLLLFDNIKTLKWEVLASGLVPEKAQNMI